MITVQIPAIAKIMMMQAFLLVQSFQNESPSRIAATLGWKEGRVWINQKLAGKFAGKILVGMLRDLQAIDRRLKTSEEPPKLLLTLFLQKASPL